MAIDKIRSINGKAIEDYELKQNVLTKDNNTEYTPTGDYNPVTKKYVDDKIIEIINVKSYGAVGDGSTNDTIAFKNALSACSAQQKSLFVPSGKYHITEPLTGFNYMSIYGEGRTSELLLDLNENEYCFDAFSENENDGWVYSFIMEKLAFSRYNTSTKTIGAVRISNSLRGATLRDIYVNNILHPWYFGPNIWGNIVFDNVHAYMIDPDDPVETYSDTCLPALYCHGNSIRIINSDIVGGFAKGLEINGSTSLTIENSNIAGSESTYYMKRPIILKNVTCADINNLYLECPDPTECDGDANGDAPMITVENSTKININAINLGQGSIYFDNSSGKVTNINYGQYAGGLKLLNNSQVITDESGFGHWDKNLTIENCSGNITLIEDNSINIEASENSSLLSTEPLPFTDMGLNSEDDNTDFETGDRSIKFHVESTMEYGYILSIPLNNTKIGEIYTIHAKVKRDSNISSLKIVNKGTEALANHKYPYTENYSEDNQWYDISYVVETKQANASVFLQAFSSSDGYFWLDRLTVYNGFANNFKNELNTRTLASKKYVDDNKFSGKYSDLTGAPDLTQYAPINSPDFTGDISLGRKADTAIGINSVGVGYNVTASGDVSHAEGNESTASNYASHAEGYVTTASGQSSHSEGAGTIASADASHAEGSYTKAEGGASHAEGNKTIAMGACSHAEGFSNNLASNRVSNLSTSTSYDEIKTAWDSGRFTLASGESSHAEGISTLSLGRASHAEGGEAIAIGDYSHAEGENTIARGRGAHVEGRYNIDDEDGKYVHIVGNGTHVSNKSNAHTLDWEGNAWYAGKVTAGANPTEDMDLTTKKYVDDKFIDPDQWIVRTSDNLSTNPITINPSSNIASNKVMVFSAQVGNNFESLTLGHGETSYGSTYITIDNTNVTVYEYYSALQTYKTYAHGLTISGFIDVIIETNSKEEAVITINTSTGMKKENVMRWIGCNGNIFTKCTNSDLTNCSLRWTCKEFNNDIQIYGDSYASMYNNRSVYRLVEWGYDSFLLDAFSGRGSAAALDSLRINLQYSKPKYIVWMMGMNDPDSTTAINASWQNTINSVISICQEKGIELILTTIPNVRGGAVDDSQIEATIRRHNFKNDYIRNSGYRYIDCALAVGADESGNWYDNMLYTDGVHPADAGAIAMASRIVQDFPEITLGVSGGEGAIYDDTGVKASITTLNEKVHGNIEPIDTTFFDIEPTKNLVNEETLQSGYMNASGDIYESASYVYTDYLKVTPGKYIVSTWLNPNNSTRYTGNLRFVTIFNSNKEVVSNLGTNTESNKFLVPEGAAYARVTLYSNNLNKLMIELTDDGISSGVYEPFVGKVVLNTTYLNPINIKNTTFYATEPTKNLVDESALRSGYMNNNGTAYSSTSYMYTDFFKVTPGKYIVASWLNTNNSVRYVGSMRFVAIYDADKNVVANLGSSVGTERFLVPSGAYYARVTIGTGQINELMVELTDDGNMTTDYAPFEGPAVVGINYIPSNIARVDNVLSKTNTTVFTPTADYNPATKKYVDDANGVDEDTLNNNLTNIFGFVAE